MADQRPDEQLVASKDSLFGFDEIITTFGQLLVAQSSTIAGSTFEVSPLDPSLFTSVLTNGGTASTGNGELTLSTNTTANGSASVQSLYPVPFSGGEACRFVSGVRLPDTGVANNVRRWGTYDANNGSFFQLNGTTVQVGVRKNGTDTLVSSGSFNGQFAFVLDTNYHLYEIFYSQGAIFFIQDHQLIHKVSATDTTLVSSFSVPLQIESTNSAGSTTNVQLFSRSMLSNLLGLGAGRRNYVVISGVGISSVATEALMTFTVNKNGIATAGVTQYTVTPGKTLKIQAIQYSATVAAGSAVSFYRVRSAGTVTVTSPIVAASRSLATNVPGPVSMVTIGDGLEIPGGQQVGVSHGGATGAIEDFVLIGYEH